MTLSKQNTQIMKEYLCDKHIAMMKQFNHHGKISTYQHSVNVLKKSCNMANFFKFSDEQIKNIIIGAILHDFYLYDYHHARKRKNGIHAWSHPVTALYNAEKHFVLNDKQRNIIRSHMYPTCLLHPPKCKEAWVVTLADKYCAIEEYVATLFSKRALHKYATM